MFYGFKLTEHQLYQHRPKNTNSDMLAVELQRAA